MAERNFVRMIFTDPRMTDLHYDWEGMVRASIAQLRMQALDNPADPRLAALVGERFTRLGETVEASIRSEMDHDRRFLEPRNW